jgi:predicted N-acetyltransferase YhbS
LTLSLHIRPETPEDAPATEAVLLAAFGPGRFAKAAERLREGNAARADLGRVALCDGELIGTCRIWPVACKAQGVMLLGPIAVRPDRQRSGIAAALIAETLKACDAAAIAAVVCVGHLKLFGPHGFVINAGDARLPGPVDLNRLLVRGRGGQNRGGQKTGSQKTGDQERGGLDAPALSGMLSVPRAARRA